MVDLKSFLVWVSLNSAMRPYAAIVGTAPAEMSEVKATPLGRIVQSRTVPKTNITITAFRGWPSGVTRPTHQDRGRTPSRAMANINREAATMATLVFWEINESNDWLKNRQKYIVT